MQHFHTKLPRQKPVLRQIEQRYINGPITKNRDLPVTTFRSSRPEVFLEILQNSQENTCTRVSVAQAYNFILKKRLWRRCFPVNFGKLLRTPFLQNTSGGCFCTFFFKKKKLVSVYEPLT